MMTFRVHISRSLIFAKQGKYINNMFLRSSRLFYFTYLTPIKFRLPLIPPPPPPPDLVTEIRRGAKIKGSELGTEKRGSES